MKKNLKKRKSLVQAEEAMASLLKRVGYKGTNSTDSIHEIPCYKIKSTLPALSDSICGAGSKKPENVYTGTEIMGIGVAHKSNSMPVSRNSNDAIELSKMRR